MGDQSRGVWLAVCLSGNLLNPLETLIDLPF
jgi:hypothetical protein